MGARKGRTGGWRADPDPQPAGRETGRGGARWRGTPDPGLDRIRGLDAEGTHFPTRPSVEFSSRRASLFRFRVYLYPTVQ